MACKNLKNTVPYTIIFKDFIGIRYYSTFRSWAHSTMFNFNKHSIKFNKVLMV